MTEIKEKLIQEELKESYLDYAMSVIIGRALPDVRDGLKPVHRRILYAMYEDGLTSNKPFKKSATTVGAVIGRYHPHGDIAVYDALVRMAQDFNLRYTLINGHGNFGSIEGFSPAAMRYTEARLSKISEELLADIDKDTVDFIPNFDGTLKEPIILPSTVPNLLINGSSGIAVGMATSMPPHNMGEVCEAILKFIENNEITVEELINYIEGPDFPTGGQILGRSGIYSAYKTGKGKIAVRGLTEISNKKIIIKEIPYMVNKASLIENIADLVRDKRIEGISDIRDESDRSGIRIVIELKNGYEALTIQNQLYKNTQLETTFSIINIALVNNQPRILNLKELIEHFISHRKEVIKRRTKFELDKAEAKAHILEGLIIALSNIDNVIHLIKNSPDTETARNNLTQTYNLTEKQSIAILEMKLQRLTSLETSRAQEEHKNLIELISQLGDILSDPNKILNIIKDDILDLKLRFSDNRKTQIIETDLDIEDEDLIKQEDVIITITHQGYIKRLPVETYKQQRRGGKGIIATDIKENDFLEQVFISNTHNYLLFFTNLGRVYWLKAYTVPSASRYSMGRNIANLLSLSHEEKITSFIPIKEFTNNENLIMVTKKGIIKKVSLDNFSRPRKGGIIAINLQENDHLINVKLTDGNQKLIIGTLNGLALKFDEKNLRTIGRNAAGVRGIRLRDKDEVVGMELATNENDTILTITENGFGKRSLISEYRQINRGGKGVINIKTTERNGKVVSIKTVSDAEELIFITKKGKIIRVSASGISQVGRNAQGVRIMKVDNDKVVSVTKVSIPNHNLDVSENSSEPKPSQ